MFSAETGDDDNLSNGSASYFKHAEVPALMPIILSSLRQITLGFYCHSCSAATAITLKPVLKSSLADLNANEI